MVDDPLVALLTDPVVRADVIRRMAKYTRQAAGCWEWTGKPDAAGYGRLQVKGKARKAHRIAWLLQCGHLPRDLCVCHRCDNPRCVRPDHFFLGTHAMNIADRGSKGRTAIGDRNGARTHPERWSRGASNDPRRQPDKIVRGECQKAAKLTEAAVIELRTLRQSKGLSYRKLGQMFGVSKRAAVLAATGQSWRHVNGS